MRSHTVFIVNSRNCESKPLVLAIIVLPSAATTSVPERINFQARSL